jgi:MoxR-like ATPase
VVDALLAGGHVLLEGVPGLGKTALVRALAEALDLTFSRVQFTPDLMPADITGTNILVEDAGGGRRFEFQPGPVFANILLADEINRATPKTQSALLEAMQDRSVTVGRHSHELAPPFFVLATQNPVELEGTYPLPEAQLDRFLFKLRVGAPSRAELHAILDRTTGAQTATVTPIWDRNRVLELQRLIREVPVARPVQDFAVRLIEGSHPQSSSIPEIRKYLRFGSSPRGAQAIMLAAKVRALRERRFSPSFADVRAVATPSLRHRLLLNFDGEAEAIDTDALVATLLERTPEG